MRILFGLSLLTAISVTTFGQSVVSPQTAGFKLEIMANHKQGRPRQWDFSNTAEKTVGLGSTVVVAIRKTNTSDREINKKSDSGWLWEVRDSSGNPVGPNKSYKWNGIINVHDAMRNGTKDSVLQPGESMLNQGTLSNGFDLSQPGTYTFQVAQHVSDDPKSPVVKSNTITITVLPADNPPPAQQ
ncbi:MAG: hypothetical protein WAM66_05720 [Acidobacteriaceae bacterium]